MLLGRLTSDPEVKALPNDNSVANFSIAVNEYQGKDKPELTFFADCTLFGNRTKGLRDYAKKGDQILVEGKLRKDSWEKDGEKRSKVYVLVDDFKSFGYKPKDQEDAPVAQTTKKTMKSSYRDNSIPI